MEEVELEVSFTLDAKAEGSAKLVVLDVGGNVQASQVHRVKLKLTPIHEPSRPRHFRRGAFLSHLVDKHNKQFKWDSQRMAFLVCGGFGVEVLCGNIGIACFTP
ncbi:trypco2 family protein, partial [Vibrio parahaemolyticus]